MRLTQINYSLVAGLLGENWYAYGDDIIRSDALNAETVARVYLSCENVETREFISRLIAAAPEMYNLLSRLCGIIMRYNQSHSLKRVDAPLTDIISFLRLIENVNPQKARDES